MGATAGLLLRWGLGKGFTPDMWGSVMNILCSDAAGLFDGTGSTDQLLNATACTEVAMEMSQVSLTYLHAVPGESIENQIHIFSFFAGSVFPIPLNVH